MEVPKVVITDRVFGNLTGEARHHIANMLIHLSHMNESPIGFTREGVENGIDAGAPTVSIGLRAEKDGTNTLIFADNGHGMVPFMTEKDISTLLGYFIDIEKGTYDPHLKIVDYLETTSRYSLQWMSALPAFSQKTAEGEDGQFGIRGVGVQGFRQYGKRGVWLTKPDPELARAYYGPGDPRSVNPPTYRLELPTMDDLRHGRIESKIELVEGDLTDPTRPGNPPMAHGTVVCIYGLTTEAINALKPKLLQRDFGDRYQHAIRDGLELRVVDMMTKSRGMKSPSGLTFVIQARAYNGTKIVDQMIQLPEHGTRFHVELYYDPVAKDSYPRYRRKRSSKISGKLPITSLAAFGRNPWVSGKLDGHIDFPDLPDSVAPWDTQKMVPVEGPVRSAWERALKIIEPYILNEIKRIDDKVRKDRSSKELDTLSAHLLAALEDLEGIPDLQGIAPVEVKPGGSGIVRVRGTTPQPHVVVRIKDLDSGRGVEGVSVQFFKFADKGNVRRSYASAISSPWTTGISGQITQTNFYALHGVGRYRVRISLPQGVHFAEGEVDEHEFVLRVDKPYQRIEFLVHAGLHRREVKKLPQGFSVGLNYNDALPEDVMYDGNRIEQLHLVDINPKHAAFIKHQELGKLELHDYIMMCAAHAVIGHACSAFSSREQLYFATELTARAQARARGK